MEFGGRVPSETNVDVRFSIVPLLIIILELPANGIGVFWKHSSVRAEPSGHRRNCQPPPWLARTDLTIRKGGECGE